MSEKVAVDRARFFFTFLYVALLRWYIYTTPCLEKHPVHYRL